MDGGGSARMAWQCTHCAGRGHARAHLARPGRVRTQGGSYGKVVSHVIIGLKTVKGGKQLKLDPTIYDSLQKEKVGVVCVCVRACEE